MATAQETRQRILTTAENCYAEHGFEGMSLRRLTEQAGVNLAAVSYHFGSKKQLANAMFRARLEPINEERVRELERLEQEAKGDPAALEKIMHAFIWPVMRQARTEEGEPNTLFLRMIGRGLAEPYDFWQDDFRESFQQLGERFRQTLSKTLPELEDAELQWRFHLAVCTMLGTLLRHEFLESCFGDSLEAGFGVRELTQRLVTFTSAALRSGTSVAALPES